MSTPLLDISKLMVSFATRAGEARVLDGVELSVVRGEAVAVVGESGSGKSMTALAVMGLLAANPGPKVTGSIRFDGQELVGMPEAGIRRLRGRRIGMIFQDPMSSLNPVLTIGRQLTEHLRYHLHMGKAESRAKAVELLDHVGIPDPTTRIDSYPHQFSGGMRQRAMIAMAIACKPDLLIADEPTTALDVTVQSEIIALVMRLRAEFGMSMLWITHDLAAIAGLADRVAIMYSGRVIESAPVDTVFGGAAHPYTRALLAAAPTLTTPRDKSLFSIEGYPPDPVARAPGCAFAPRCREAIERCRSEQPPSEQLESGHHAACFRAPDFLAKPEPAS